MPAPLVSWHLIDQPVFLALGVIASSAGIDLIATAFKNVFDLSRSECGTLAKNERALPAAPGAALEVLPKLFLYFPSASLLRSSPSL